MGSRILPILILLVGGILLLSASTFVVREQDMALRVQFKSVIGKDYKPGLHFKVPFIDDVFKFDRRVLTKKFDGEQFLTSESQVLSVDYYIKWRILDVQQFYQATGGGDEIGAGSLVGQRIQDGIKNAVARRTLKDIVISDRQQVTGEFIVRASESLRNLGVELIDVRVQRIDLQEDVAARVYESMKQTFEGIARTQRGEGDRESQIIRSEAERKRTEIIAEANANAQRIRGEGDATAAALYAAAYNRNPEFYSFYRSLQAYRASLGKEGDVLVVSPDSEFFRYLKSSTPQRR
ncbi:MAG: rane protease subunit, stomatin/prohibitin [Steroidobacteraceae bacterium]|jgi:membrane protease subunit HflC|nr:rane protease subunit, stomatin/prohibitin [Steroidobacteraceae bacterium]